MQVHAPQKVVDQIVHRHLKRNLVNMVLHFDMGLAPHIKEQVEKILSSKNRDVTCQVGKAYFLGEETKKECTAREIEVLQREGYSGVVELCLYRKLFYKSVLYSTVTSSSKVDDSLIYTWKDTVGSIVCFVKFEFEGQQVAGVFLNEHYVQPMQPAKHIVQINSEETLLHFECIENVRCPAVSIQLSKYDRYLVPMANCHEID
ncbi:Protein FAM107B [Frankliniella fusca]|uniref:Protein FAM107B n=1 Tax=Frankliniella fusca TaxID=407009 RepID=A0AAE1LFP6_9NEOP|nr:Protein FAM107B [Frankliniella fusca]